MSRLTRRLAIRLSVLAVCATAFVVVPAISAVEAKTVSKKTSRHMHVAKHGWHSGHHYGRAWPVGGARPIVGYYDPSGPICPAVGHSFDCKIWPPPYEDDPDRKTSKH